jgi:hypothetical protein
MERVYKKHVWSSKIRMAAAVIVLLTVLLSAALPAYVNGQNTAQQTPQLSYPFSVINSTLSEGANVNSYQLVVEMDNAQTISLAKFNLNMTSPFYGAGNVSSLQITKTNVQTGSYFNLSYSIDVTGNPAKGDYRFPLYIQYYISFPYGNTYPEHQSFNLTVLFLGTSSLTITDSTSSVISGENNNLTLVVHNAGTGNITDLKISTAAQSSLTFLSSFPTIASLTPGSFFNFTEPAFVSSAATGVVSINFTLNFVNPYGVQSSSSNVTVLSVQPLMNSIDISSSTDVLTSGQTNNVSFTFINDGNGDLSNVETSPSSQSQLSFLNQFPSISYLMVGHSFTWVEPIYVSTSVSGAITINFAETYTTSSGTQSSEQRSLGLYSQQSSNSLNVSLEVRMVSPYVMLGLNSSAVVDITNIGNSTIYSPVVTISAPSGFTVSGNSTFYYPNETLISGDSFTVPVLFSSSPSTTQGAYSASVSINYYNDTGKVITRTFYAGFLALNKVSLVLQGYSENSSGGTITISGTLLDEGAGSAYYLTLNATFSQLNVASSGTTYLGEVDSNTPTPFSLTFALPTGIKNGTSEVSVQVSYQNYYGVQVNSTLLSHSMVYKAASNQSNQTTTPTKHYRTLGPVEILLIVLIVVVILVAGLLLVVRKRGSAKAKSKQ